MRTSPVKSNDDVKRNTFNNSFATVTEEDFFIKLEKSRNQANQGKVRDVDDVIADIRVKYGLLSTSER